MLTEDAKRHAPITRLEACVKMSTLLRRALGTNITAPEIDKLFRYHWITLSLLAHQIHEAPTPEIMTANAAQAGLGPQPQ